VTKILPYVPDIPVVLAHMGGRSEDPREEEILLTFPENVYIDTAMSAKFQAIEDFERLTAAYGPERVILASDFPYDTQKNAIQYVKNSHFSESEKEMILGENAMKILGDRIRVR